MQEKQNWNRLWNVQLQINVLFLKQNKSEFIRNGTCVEWIFSPTITKLNYFLYAHTRYRGFVHNGLLILGHKHCHVSRFPLGWLASNILRVLPIVGVCAWGPKHYSCISVCFTIFVYHSNFVILNMFMKITIDLCIYHPKHTSSPPLHSPHFCWAMADLF